DIERLRRRKIPPAAAIGFGGERKTAAVSALLRPHESVVAAIGDGADALLAVGRLNLASGKASTADGEGVVTNQVAVARIHANPAPAESRQVGGVGKPRHHLGLISRVRGGEIEFAGSPCKFVAVGEIVAEVLELLVSAVQSPVLNGVGEKAPAEL